MKICPVNLSITTHFNTFNSIIFLYIQLLSYSVIFVSVYLKHRTKNERIPWLPIDGKVLGPSYTLSAAQKIDWYQISIQALSFYLYNTV